MTSSPTTTSSSRKPLSRTLQVCVVLALATAVRIAACVVWSDNLTHDRDAYLGIAGGIADGRGFCSPGSLTPTAYRPPLYPLLLAAGLTVLSPAMATAVVNVFAGAVTVLATWGAARQMGASSRTSLVAALIVALDPLLIRYSAQPMTECEFAALVTTAFWSLSRAFKPPHSLLAGAVTGILLGLAALCRPTILPFAAVVPAMLWTRSVTTQKQLLAMLVGLLLTVAPWTIRNAVVFHRPIITTTHGGYTLLLANNPVFYKEVARQPWGTIWSDESLEAWQRSMLAEAAAELGPSPSEIAVDRWQAARARRNIQDDPAGFAAAVLYRVRSFWSLSPRSEASGPIRWISAAWYAALFALAAVGLWQTARRDLRWAAILLLLIASIQALHLVYWTDSRMRAPLHPVFALLAAVAVTRRRVGDQ